MNPSMQTGELWSSQTLASLMDYIVNRHHTFCREQLPRLAFQFKQVIAAHGKDHPELKRMEALFAAMAKDLQMHLVKEEQTLFPYIARVERALQHKDGVSWPPFGTVENPIRMMVLEHDQASQELRHIRYLSNAYTPPSGASEAFVTLYDGLRTFEQDMNEHIQSEDRLLFPRAILMEAEACTKDKPEAR